MQVGMGAIRSGNDIIANDDQGVKKQCTVFDNCRACTFKELQQTAACQETGYRRIMHCKTTPNANRRDVITETYVDTSCQEAATELAPLRGGEFAPYRSGPFSVYWFLVIMAVLAYATVQVL